MSNNESGTSYSLGEQTLQSVENSNISMPVFESTAISPIKDSANSVPWAKLESISNYFNSVDVQDNYTFGILEKEGANTANSTTNLDFILASIYKCISKKHFTLQKINSNSKDGIIALLKDLSKNGTFINGEILGLNMESGLKNGDKIGVAYYLRDMTLKECDAFKFHLDTPSKFENESFPTFIESSMQKSKSTHKRTKSVSFVSYDSVDCLT